MRVVRIVLMVLLAVVVIVVLGGFVVYNDWTRGPLPQYDGELTVPGLIETVEILRDEWGVPHIYASNTHDLLFAQGYTHAQDRWWQMEFFRHVGNGTIEELTGKTDSVLSNDIFLRTLGFRQVVEEEVANMDDETRLGMQAFADGVNAYILSRPAGDLAFEYNVLGITGVRIEIEPWTPADSLIWGKVMALNLSGNYDSELLRSDLYENLGADLTNDWIPDWPFGEKPTIVFPEELPLTDATLSNPLTDTAGIIGIHTQLAGNVALDEGFAMARGADIGSNNWVASGDMTESGLPLLANDMHLSIQMPSIWYEIGLHCQPVSDQCPFNVTGFTFAPNPLVVAGHNENIAWGHTNVNPDTQDLYAIKVNPDDPYQYEWNGEWRDMTVREEVINFGDGEAPLTLQVRMTHFGPIINDNQIDEETNELLGFNNEDPLAMRWTALEQGTIFTAVFRLNRASNWEEFRDALTYWTTPSQNVVYADRDGNIGYQVPGRIPIRAADHAGTLPIDGSTDTYEWLGDIPFDLLPRMFNPARGYIATANQAVVPLEYYDQLREALGDEFGEDANYIISQEWSYGYRGQRIDEMLEQNAPHSIATFQAIHGDNKNLSAEQILPYLAELEFDDATLADLRDWLLEWDFQMHMDSPQAALYAEFWSSLMANLYADQLGETTEAHGNNQMLLATYQLMEDPENDWWDDIATEDVVETRDDILTRAFTEAYQNTVSALGQDRNNWKWGSLHTTTFVSNPLGASGIDLIENLVNRGPVPTSGGGEIVNATGWNAARGFDVRSGPSERVIYDLSDFGNSVSIHTTGQSGHPFSPHYGDQIDQWRNIEYHPMLWTREQVEAAAVNRLVLSPGN